MLNCARTRICFAIPGKQFLLQFTITNISYFIDFFLSSWLPTTITQQVAATEEDDEAAMMAEFEVNFS